MKNKTPGIYKITNLINGKFYVGSAVNLYQREIQHFFHLKQRTHHNIKLQNTFNKHGEENFKLEVLEFIEDKTKLIEREQYYIDTLKPHFNICKIAGSPLGVKHTSEYRRKCSERMQGNMPWNKGLTGYFTVNQRKENGLKSKSVRLKNGTLGLSPSEETKQKRRTTKALNPYKHNNETLKKISAIRKEYYLTHEGHRKNQPVSLETKRKQSLAARRPKIYNRKPIIQLDLLGNFMQEFPSIRIASSQLQLTGIHEVLAKRNKSAGGFKWMYKSEYEFNKQVILCH